MTQKHIDDAIKNCRWKSQNRGLGRLIEDVCTSQCLPCPVVIDNGKCETLIELFKSESEDK